MPRQVIQEEGGRRGWCSGCLLGALFSTYNVGRAGQVFEMTSIPSWFTGKEQDRT
jgi:hypothetical protein